MKIADFGHYNLAGTYSFVKSDKAAGVVGPRGNHGKDCQIAMRDWGKQFVIADKS